MIRQIAGAAMDTKDLAQLKGAQLDGLTLDVGFRMNELKKLAKYLKDHKNGLVEAMTADFMTKFGAVAELDHCVMKLEYLIRNFEGWAKDEKVGTGWSIAHALDRVWIHRDPIGVVLIISSWNAPLLLTLEPLMGAIAAGCCAVVKPSEISQRTTEYLLQTLPVYLDYRTFKIVEGGPAETESLMASFQWDLIFYTGSERVGRLIYELAAKSLTPVVLELGGKSPTLVLGDLSDKQLQVTADRIIATKAIKAGQLCISIDYILCEEAVYEKFLGCLMNSVKMYENGSKSKDLDRIVNEKHWTRLNALLQGHGGSVICDGIRDLNDLYFGLTIISNPNPQSALMQEEIFGPILPVLRVKNLDEAIGFVNARPKPLIIYAFTENSIAKGKIQSRTRSGSCSFNDAVFTYMSTCFMMSVLIYFL